MTPLDEDRIARWGRTLQSAPEIRLFQAEDGSFAEFRSFCDDLERLVPSIQIKQEDADGHSSPAIRVSDNIFYQAVPADQELEPFLKALQKQTLPSLPALSAEALGSVATPAMVKVYVLPHCPFCPQVVTRLLAVAETSRQVHLTVIDGTLFPDAVRVDRIRSVPTVILDDRLRWTGQVDIDELIERIRDRDPARLGAEPLRRMIEDGHAEVLADLMVESGILFPALFDLLTHEKWPVRLGAMVVFEYVAQDGREIVTCALKELETRFEGAEDPVRGDLLHVIEESGITEAVPFLERVVSGPYTRGIRNAAREALDSFGQQDR